MARKARKTEHYGRSGALVPIGDAKRDSNKKRGQVSRAEADPATKEPRNH